MTSKIIDIESIRREKLKIYYYKGERQLAYLFDPRCKEIVETNNPALILADCMIRMGAVKPDKDFWEKITLLADHCDLPYDKKRKKEIEKIIKKESNRLRKRKVLKIIK